MVLAIHQHLALKTFIEVYVKQQPRFKIILIYNHVVLFCYLVNSSDFVLLLLIRIDILGLADVTGDTASKDSGISQMSDVARPMNGMNGHHRYFHYLSSYFIFFQVFNLFFCFSLDMDNKPLSADSSEAGSTKNSSPTPQNSGNVLQYYQRLIFVINFLQFSFCKYTSFDYFHFQRGL